MIKLYVDAATNQITQQVGIGFVVYANNQQDQQAKTLPIQVDNHQAEFLAVYHALHYVITHYNTNESLFLYSDSKVVVKALQRKSAKGKWQQVYLSEILPLLEQFPVHFIDWFSDKTNQMPDILARRALTNAYRHND